MELLTLLIVLGLVQLWGSGSPVQRDGWYVKWSRTVRGMTETGKLRLVLIVAPPAVLVLLLQAWFYGVLLGLLLLLLYVVVLLYSLGRGDFNDAVQRYISAWSAGDFESAYDKALAIGDFRQSDAIDNHLALHDSVREAVAYDGFQRWFAPVFWFLLLGPCGALGYRLSYLCGRDEELEPVDRQLALRFVHYLDWIPARLLALTFALTGNFVQSFSCCSQRLLDNMPAPELLDDCVLAAVSSEEEQQARPADEKAFIDFGRREVNAAMALLSRSVVCWLIVVAVLALAG